MYAIPGLLALLTFIYTRPQEIFPALRNVPFLYLFVLLTAVGWMLDVRLGFTRLRSSGLLAGRWPTSSGRASPSPWPRPRADRRWLPSWS
jgi:hypothetical protein